MDADRDILINPNGVNPATVTATPNVLGKVDLAALRSINVDFASIEATRDINIDAGSTLDAFGVEMRSQSNIDLHAFVFIEAPFSDIFARRQIVMRADADDVSVAFSNVRTSSVGNASIELHAGDIVNAAGATVAAAATVTFSAALITANDSTISATPNIFGKVEMDADTIDIPGATIEATREVVIDSGGMLWADDAVISAGNQGVIDLDAGTDLLLNGATLKARKTIDLDAVDSIFAAGANLLAQGAVTSKVTATAGADLILIDAVIRARALIDLTAGGVADLTRSSIGITHLGSGDLKVTASAIIVTDAVLKAPDDLLLIGTVVGIPTDISTGILPPV